MRLLSDLLAELQAQNIRLWADGEKLQYSVPKGASFSRELRAEVGGRKSAILELLRQAGSATRARRSAPIPRPQGSEPSLSLAQEGILFQMELEGNAAYNIPAVVHLKGLLDLNVLERSFNEIARRHEVLRATFLLEDGRMRQQITPVRELKLRVVDFAGVEVPGWEEVRRMAGEEAAQPFDLARGPLWRVTVLCLSETRHVLLLTLHHTVSDGWSLEIILRELTALYDAYSMREPSPLADLEIQYGDYAAWQKEWLAGGALEAELAYWRRQLAGMPPTLELPFDRPRTTEGGFRSAIHEFTWPAALTTELKRISESAGASMYMTLLAGLASLAATYSGRRDIPIGTSFANRSQKVLEPLIGFFVNSIVLRTKVDADMTFRELLSQVRQGSLDAYAHPDLPFDTLVRDLRPARTPGQHPIYQLMFVWQGPTAPEHVLRSGLTMSLEVDSGIARCDLTLSMKESGGVLSGWWAYSPKLFDAETVERLSARFEKLLADAASRPGARLSELYTAATWPLPPVRPGRCHADNRTPLSYHQERLWFIDEFETRNVYADSPTYHNIPLLLRLTGPVDPARLEQSLNAVIQRHPLLRAGIFRAGERAWQSVRDRLAPVLSVADVTLAEDLLPQAIAESQRPFRLHEDALIRAVWLRAPHEVSLLVLTIHHIVADRESIKIVAEDLAAFYNGHPPSALALTYSDFAEWQRNLPRETRESLLTYWRCRLGGEVRALELQVSRDRPAVHTFTLARETIRIEGVPAAARSFHAALAALLIVLHRYSRQDEIVVGTSLDCRAEASGIVGPISNLVALRCDLSGDPSLSELVDRVRRTVDEAHSHRFLPFDLLVKELRLRPDMSRTALFDVLFQFEKELFQAPRLAGMQTEWVDINAGYGKYDLNVFLAVKGASIEGVATYNSDLYEALAIRQMMGHFGEALRSVAGDPALRTGDIELLSEQERERQIYLWNATEAAWPSGQTLHGLFEAQAALTPNKIAVLCDGDQLTFAELETRANRLAHYLIHRGVERENLVALCLERSVQMIVAMLAVLKAGAAYLPIDPHLPDERMNFVFEDSGARTLIVSPGLAGSRFERIPVQVVLNDELASAYPAAPPETCSGPKDLAYCLYTSGSTGRPKGVLVEHRNIVRLLVNDKTRFHFTGNDVWTMFHAYTFDFSVWEMYGALLFGGRLAMVREETTRDPAQLLELIRKEGVTILNQTPSAFYALSARICQERRPAPSLRCVVFGGEALVPSRLKEFRAVCPAVTLVNMYGITETTVHVTYKEITDSEIERETSNIGVPIPTTTVYILDQQLRLLPAGVPGELCVGGAGVARGYLRRDDLTKEKFVPNPYRAGERIYRSGDLASQTPSGELIYHGRIDNQVQVRGFRVELGEIESCLAKHPTIREAAVIAEAESSGSTRLIAYAVPREGMDCATIRRYLRLAKEGRFDGRKQCELPNGMTVVHQNKSETEFLYKEVFLSRSYLRHGIALPANACVFDVGANIGMFSLLAALECESARIFAFEPIPATSDTLRLNMELHGVDARVFACGLAGEAKQATFTWYPHVSIFSGRFADPGEESEIIQSFLLCSQDGVAESGELTAGQIEEIVKERLVGTPVVCPLRTVSSIIREHGLERIDLLKIDAEKSELEVLAGIDEKDWRKVQQIAIEVHNTKGQEETIRGLLERRGFDVTLDQDPWFRNTTNVNLYARRTRAAKAIPAAPRPDREWRSVPALNAELQKYLKQSLPEYMIPSRIVLVENFPLTENGKVDRKALATAKDSRRESTTFAPPRTQEEDAIAEIWRRLLGLERVGIHENFFELGGHSLLATQLVSRLRDRFSVELPVRTLFEGPTVAELAAALRPLRQAGAAKTPELVATVRDGYRLQSASGRKF